MQKTSKDAYKSITLKEKQAMWALIISTLKKLKIGATSDKIASILGVQHEQVARRMNELVQSKIVFNTPHRRPTRKGRNAIVRQLYKKYL